MNLPNSNNVTILKEKKYTKYLPLAYYYGWNPRGNYDVLPHRSDILRRIPHELHNLEVSQQRTFEKTDEFLEALEVAFLELERKYNGDSNFEFITPYAPFTKITTSLQELDELLQWIVQEGMEWMIILPENHATIEEETSMLCASLVI